ncbi:hypothetical protein Hanom_Chr09g00856801 [Helianthus anomalus]
MSLLHKLDLTVDLANGSGRVMGQNGFGSGQFFYFFARRYQHCHIRYNHIQLLKH